MMMHFVPRLIWDGKGLQNIFIEMKYGNVRIYTTSASGGRGRSERVINGIGIRGMVHIHDIYTGRLKNSG